MSRRRVLVNVLSLTHGGGRSYVVNLLRELDRDPRGFEFTVLAASGQVSREEAGRLRLVEVRLPSPRVAARVVFRVLYEEALLPFRDLRSGSPPNSISFAIMLGGECQAA